jgi:hypothetical protein
MKLHALQFTDEAAAIADPVLGPYYFPYVPGEGGGWNTSVVSPNISIWMDRILQPGFWAIAATSDSNTALAQHDACRLAWDDENAVILGGTFTGNEMSAMYVSPVQSGAYNPWNGPAPE